MVKIVQEIRSPIPRAKGGRKARAAEEGNGLCLAYSSPGNIIFQYITQLRPSLSPSRTLALPLYDEWLSITPCATTRPYQCLDRSREWCRSNRTLIRRSIRCLFIDSSMHGTKTSMTGSGMFLLWAFPIILFSFMALSFELLHNSGDCLATFYSAS